MSANAVPDQIEHISGLAAALGGKAAPADVPPMVWANLRARGIHAVTDPLYGADPAGATDSTPAFVAALAAGDNILVPKGGTFLVGDVVVGSDKTLAGGGTIKKKGSSPSALHVQGSGATIRGLVFAGEVVGGQPNSDIKLGDGASDVLIEGNHFKSPIYSAIAAATDTGAGGTPYATRVSGVQILGNRFTSGAGNYIRPLHLHSVDNITISGNLIRDCLFDAIRLRENSGYVLIDGNQFINIGDPTWPNNETRDAVDSYWSGSRLTITNNIIRTCAAYGLDIKGASPDGSVRSQNIIITGNQISGCKVSGICLAGDANYDGAGSYKFLTGALVANNVIEDCNRQATDNAEGGIRLRGLVAYSTIQNNYIFANQGRGIHAHNQDVGKAAWHDVKILDNTVLNNGRSGQTLAGIHATGGSNVTIRGNTCANDATEANPFQSIGIFVTSANDGLGYTPTANSIGIAENVCVNNLSQQIACEPSGARVNGLAYFRDNVESGTLANFRATWQRQRFVAHGSAAPAAGEGTFRRGDIILNTDVSAGGNAGWTCTVAGNPGTWETWGPINLSGSAVYDPPSLAAGAFGPATTVAVTGAALGDFVEVSFSLNSQGVIFHAWVSAANAVSVIPQNATAGVIDLASGTLRARVRKP